LWCSHLLALAPRGFGPHERRAGQRNAPAEQLPYLVVTAVLPDQQVWNFARIIEICPHKQSRYDWHILAVQPRPITKEVLVPSPPLLTLIHRLIAVIALSSEIPVRGRAFKKGVKVRTPKSPASSDDPSPDFAAFYVFPHCSCAQAQHIRCFAQREQTVSNRKRVYF
jgi:hypothetical protein